MSRLVIVMLGIFVVRRIRHWTTVAPNLLARQFEFCVTFSVAMALGLTIGPVGCVAASSNAALQIGARANAPVEPSANFPRTLLVEGLAAIDRDGSGPESKRFEVTASARCDYDASAGCAAKRQSNAVPLAMFFRANRNFAAARPLSAAPCRYDAPDRLLKTRHGMATNTPGAIPEGSPSQFTRAESLSGRASARQVSEMADSMKVNGYQGPPI